MKHTPGPWTEIDGLLTCSDGLPPFAFQRPQEELQANARLIAAAPDLLEACHMTLAAIAADLPDWAIIECKAKLRTAIAKAEGNDKKG